MSKPVVIRSVLRLPIRWYYKLLAPIINLIGQRKTFRIIATSPDYVGISVLFGLFKYEKGQRYEFVIRGTEKFAEIVTAALVRKGFVTFYK